MFVILKDVVFLLQEFFKRYVRLKGLSERTVGHYVTGINSINVILEKYDFPIKNVFETKTVADLEAIKLFLQSNAEFQEKNSIGHNMYSVSFRHFCEFVCGDYEFFNHNIQRMDIIAEKPPIVTSTTTTYRRNQIIVEQSLEGAGYCCEHNAEHQTFVAKATNHAYMEGHHLIPMKYQDNFDCSIDVYANIVCLCPICHKLLHYGQTREKSFVAEGLFEKRQERLIQSGIDISKQDFLQLVI
jgi:5-methylcytosine-specific restriction protein A